MVWARFDQGETVAGSVGIAGDRIRSFVKRIEQLDTEIARKIRKQPA